MNFSVNNSKSCLLCIVLIALCFLESSCGLPDQESALYRVMQRLKFRVTKINAAQPARLDRLDALFLWRLRRELSDQEIEEIRRFVEDGGTLIVAGNHESLNSLLHHYGLEMHKASNSLETSHRIPTDPLFPNRPVDEIYSNTDYAIQSSEGDVAPLYGQGTDYSIVTFHEGDGHAVFMSCPEIFARHGLQDNRNATFLYNLMTTLPQPCACRARAIPLLRCRFGIASKPVDVSVVQYIGWFGRRLYRGDCFSVSDSSRQAIRQPDSGGGITQARQFRVCARHDRLVSERRCTSCNFEADTRHISVRSCGTMAYQPESGDN